MSTGYKLSAGDRALVWLAGTLGPLVILALGSTWRITVRGQETVDRLHAAGRPALFAFWHGVLLPLEYACRHQNIQVLSSLHRDGEISARVMKSLGYGVVRGSSTRGSAREAKSGIFYLAEHSNGVIVPVGVGALPARRMSSWDGFLVPPPFARVAIVYGEPLEWSEDRAPGERAAVLTAALNGLTEDAENLATAGGC
jgi:lysophospholipid acyltransferase (LPLAT)-like uncharacterized protein